MPIKIPDKLPAAKTLRNENIFIMTQKRAMTQDIRPLKIGLLNLMPLKIETETQIIRLLSNSPLQVELILLRMGTHESKNTPAEHLGTFYQTMDDIAHTRLDGLVITGAPVETLEFEMVDYWEELKKVMQWSKTNVTSTFHICWGAQAGLYYHYGIQKYPLEEKCFGVFEHKVKKKNIRLLRGFDDRFFAPHSRYTAVREGDLKPIAELELLASSKEAGPYIIATRDGRQIFTLGHSEYDANTLMDEYKRDIGRGLCTGIPKNYFKDSDPEKPPIVRWRAHANLLFGNWLNYYVYQETPYDLEEIR